MATTNSNNKNRVTIAPPTEQSATRFYDKPCFIGEGFDRGVASIDFWVGVQTKQSLSIDHRFVSLDPKAPNMAMLTDLHLYRPSHGAQTIENMTADIALKEMLEDTIGEVHDLPVNERGHYLAQLVTRCFSDGTIDWLRFRLAHLLATYYSMLPTACADYMGMYETLSLEVDVSDTKIFGWDTEHGVFLDLVHVFRQADEHLNADIEAVTAFARQEWPGEFAGIRYLPLEDLSDGRLYLPDGTWQPIVERDLLDLEQWL